MWDVAPWVHVRIFIKRYVKAKRYVKFTIQLTWHHGDFKIMEPKQYRQFTRLFFCSGLDTRLGHIICYCTSRLQKHLIFHGLCTFHERYFKRIICNIKYSYCNIKHSYCILVEHKMYIYHYNTTAYVCKLSLMRVRLCKL